VAAAVALSLYAALAGTLGSVLLQRAAWPRRAPRLAVLAWQALSISLLGAVVLAGVAFWLPEGALSSDLASLIHACEAALRQSYVSAVDASVHLAGVAVAVAVTIRAGAAFLGEFWSARRERSKHLILLRLAAKPHPGLRALVLEHPTPTAYCLPGRGGQVVLTSAAIAVLDSEELAAVVAHERAHLRERHHVVIAVARALERTLPWLPVFRVSRREQQRLVEMIADDAAARRSTPRAVARAVVHLAEAALAPRTALGAAQVAAEQRVERMLNGAPPLGILGRVLVTSIVTALAVAPLFIAAAPAFMAMQTPYCLVGVLAG
jgi:Zn-dependent protease with chaperone function